jgi:hypothetical protein
MKNDTIMGLYRTKSQCPIKLKLSKNKYMGEKYPSCVCIDCLNDAIKDDFIHKGKKLAWSDVYSVYVAKCDICGDEKECTEPRDAGYPSFEFYKERLRIKKINKLRGNL